MSHRNGMLLLPRNRMFEFGGRIGRNALLCFACLVGGSALFAQGPPFQVDDPVPVDFRHYEFYIFGATDGTPAEMDYAGPAFEFNWGAVPRVQVHAVLPWGG